MRISTSTLAVLRSFSSINQRLLIQPGNVLEIESPAGVRARAVVPEQFPVQIAIYDLGKFLAVCDLFHEPGLDFRTNFVRITESDGKAEAVYAYSPPSLIRRVTFKDSLTPPDATVEFELPEDALDAVQRAAIVLNTNHVSFLSDGKAVQMALCDRSNPNKRLFSVSLTAEPNGFRYESIFDMTNLRLVKGSYRVVLTNHRGSFKNTSGYDLTYWVACDVRQC